MGTSMPRPSEPPTPVTESQVLAQLARSRGPQSLREIAAALGLRQSGRRALIKLTRKMKMRAEIIEYPNRRIGLPKEKQGTQFADTPKKGGAHRGGFEQRPQGKPRTEERSEPRPVRPEANQLTGRSSPVSSVANDLEMAADRAAPRGASCA
jgi:hypothetical protein